VRVEARLAAPVAYVEPIHLDALLAWVVAYRILHSNPEVAQTEPDVVADDIALPVERVTIADTPIWCATSFLPKSEVDPAIVRYRKRPPEEGLIEWSSPCKLRFTQGKFRAYDLPLVVRPATSLIAYVLGSEVGVRDLLREARHLGKKRSQGWGRVAAWTVSRVEGDFPWQDGAGRPTRAVPGDGGAVQGVRPPYWYRPWWVPAVAP
jgi:hypothetical protein